MCCAVAQVGWRDRRDFTQNAFGSAEILAAGTPHDAWNSANENDGKRTGGQDDRALASTPNPVLLPASVVCHGDQIAADAARYAGQRIAKAGVVQMYELRGNACMRGHGLYRGEAVPCNIGLLLRI